LGRYSTFNVIAHHWLKAQTLECTATIEEDPRVQQRLLRLCNNVSLEDQAGMGRILTIPATKRNKFRRFQCSSSDRPLTELSPEQRLSLLWIRARSRILFGSCRRLRPIPGHTPTLVQASADGIALPSAIVGKKKSKQAFSSGRVIIAPRRRLYHCVLRHNSASLSRFFVLSLV
jgi:hypothetical protein